MATLESGRVAPRAGAWIETTNQWPVKLNVSVASRAGAWIETICLFKLTVKLGSPPRGGGVASTCFRIFGPYQAMDFI